MDLSQRLDEMELAIHKPSFRKGTGRANEVNYWVFDYPPEKELEVRERVEYLKNKNDRGDDDFELDENENKSASKTTRGAIKKFEGYVISAEKDSLSYMVMVSPYLSMLRSGSSIPAGDFNIAIDKLENALKNAKGYYEFVGTKGKSKVILRFNINSFKNGYTISDLLKMNLSIYAIKVGRTTIDMLNVSKELEMDVSIIPKDNPSYEESNEVEDTSTSSKTLDVFDVLLAGVEAVD